MGGKGLRMKIQVQIDMDDPASTISVDSVQVLVDHIKVEVLKSRHKALHAIFSPGLMTSIMVSILILFLHI
jgi:hypothetical protein